MNSGYYTGIGSRETPLDIRQLMTEIAMHCQGYGLTLRTGASSAADKAFELGAGLQKEIYIPFEGWDHKTGITSLSIASTTLAKKVWEHRRKAGWFVYGLEDLHVDERWENLHPGTQALLAKTMCMVLGKNLDNPSDSLICWTPLCKITGISSHPIALATMSRIPVFNLADYETIAVINDMLRKDLNPSDIFENRRTRCERGLEIYGCCLE